MGYDNDTAEHPPVTDWVNDWDLLQEWLRAFPDDELDPERESTWANGQVRGPRTIPVLLHR